MHNLFIIFCLFCYCILAPKNPVPNYEYAHFYHIFITIQIKYYLFQVPIYTWYVPASISIMQEADANTYNMQCNKLFIIRGYNTITIYVTYKIHGTYYVYFDLHREFMLNLGIDKIIFGRGKYKIFFLQFSQVSFFFWLWVKGVGVLKHETV